MKGKNRLIWAIVFVLTIFLMFSCSSSKERDEEALKEEKFNAELAKISLSLAMIYAKTSIEAELCEVYPIFYEDIKKTQELDQAEDEYMRQYFDEENAKREAYCKVIKKAHAYTSKAVDIALNTKKVPSDGFLFYAFSETDSEGDDIYIEETIGLFATLEECKFAEELLRNIDVGTRKCRPWKSSEVYKLYDHLLSEMKKEEN